MNNEAAAWRGEVVGQGDATRLSLFSLWPQRGVDPEKKMAAQHLKKGQAVKS